MSKSRRGDSVKKEPSGLGVAGATRRSVQVEVEVPGTPEEVWRALTDPVLLAEWLLPVLGFRLEPGARGLS